MISGFEGEVTHPYFDQAGVETICIGHVIKSSERTIFPSGEEVSHETCEALLRGDLAGAENDVNTMVTVDIIGVQVVFDALVDFQINTGGLAHSTLLKLINQGKYREAAEWFEPWDHIHDPHTGKLVVDPGLRSRRLAEKRLYLSGLGGDWVTDAELVALINKANAQLIDARPDVLSPQRTDEDSPEPFREAITRPDPILPPKREDDA